MQKPARLRKKTIAKHRPNPNKEPAELSQKHAT